MEDKKNFYIYMCYWIRRVWWLKEKLLYFLRYEREVNIEWGLVLIVVVLYIEIEKLILVKVWKLMISWLFKLIIIIIRFFCLNYFIEIIIMGIFMLLLSVYEIWSIRNNGYLDYIVINMYCYICVFYVKFL